MSKYFKNIHPLSYIIFFLPTYLIKFKVDIFSFNLLEMFILITFLWWLFYIYSVKKYIKSVLKQKLLVLLGIFLLLIGVTYTSFTSQNILKSLGILKSWFLIPILFLIILLTTKPKIKQLLRALCWSGFIVALVGIFYLLLGILTYDNRLGSFYLHPNHLAMYLAPCWLIAFNLLTTPKKRNKKFLWSFVLLIISVTLFFTFSYGAWLGIFLSSLIILIDKKNIKKICLALLIFVIILIIGFCHPKFQNILTSERSSLHSRLIIWRSALHILKDHWIGGIGPGTFQIHYLSYQEFYPSYLEWAVPQPHNIFLAFWLQAGLVGFIGFLVILERFFTKTIRTIRQNKKEASFSLLLFSLMTYTLIHGLVDTLYWKNDLSIIFWLIIGLAILNSQAVKFPVQFIDKE
jgi:putative inorganic carbon (hco3(-)) transporter